MKKATVWLALALVLTLCAPLALAQEATLNIAYQYGMAYAPLLIMKEYGLIEKHYDGEVSVQWQVLNSGAAINEGITAGSIDVGAMGVGPAVTGVSVGVPYRIFAGLSSQPHGIVTNDEGIRSLSDFTPETKIALVNIGSIQHVLLAMAAQHALGDAHALDNNIIAMSHPDGMTALVSGAVQAQLTTSPYLQREAEYENLHVIPVLEEVWPVGNAFIVGMASEKFHDEQPALYDALIAALEEAITLINEQPEEAAALLAEGEEVDPDVMLTWLSDPACIYRTEVYGLVDMAAFMVEAGFLPSAPTNFADYTFSNVTGE